MVSNPSTTACVRLDAFPDAGISRLRLIGRVDPAARRPAGWRWFNSLPVDHAARCLAEAGISADLAYRLLEQRPLGEDWRAKRWPRPARGRPRPYCLSSRCSMVRQVGRVGRKLAPGLAVLGTVAITATPDGHTRPHPATSTRQRWRPPLPMATPRLHRDRWARPAGNVRVSYRMACASAARSVGRSQATALMRVPGPSSGMTAQPSPTAWSTPREAPPAMRTNPTARLVPKTAGPSQPGTPGQSQLVAEQGSVVDVDIEAKAQPAGLLHRGDRARFPRSSTTWRRRPILPGRAEKKSSREAIIGCRCQSR